jgi:hypothetical protein
MSDGPPPFAPGEKPPVFTADQLATAHIAMANAAQTDDGAAKIASDINKITVASIAISESFQSVGEKLLTIDALKLAPPFFTTWDDMHKASPTSLYFIDPDSSLLRPNYRDSTQSYGVLVILLRTSLHMPSVGRYFLVSVNTDRLNPFLQSLPHSSSLLRRGIN